MGDLKILSETEKEKPNGDKVKGVVGKESDGTIAVLVYAGDRLFFRQPKDPTTKKPFTKKTADRYLADLLRLMTEEPEPLPPFLEG